MGRRCGRTRFPPLIAAYFYATPLPPVQGYLAQKKQTSSQDPTAGLCPGPYGGPRGGWGDLMSEVPLYSYAIPLPPYSTPLLLLMNSFSLLPTRAPSPIHDPLSRPTVADPLSRPAVAS